MILVDRNWRLRENTTVNSLITQVRAEDNDNDELEFGLDPLGPGQLQPFVIDSNTGYVYLNESIEGKVSWTGRSFSLSIQLTNLCHLIAGRSKLLRLRDGHGWSGHVQERGVRQHSKSKCFRSLQDPWTSVHTQHQQYSKDLTAWFQLASRIQFHPASTTASAANSTKTNTTDSR